MISTFSSVMIKITNNKSPRFMSLCRVQPEDFIHIMCNISLYQAAGETFRCAEPSLEMTLLLYRHRPVLLPPTFPGAWMLLIDLPPPCRQNLLCWIPRGCNMEGKPLWCASHWWSTCVSGQRSESWRPNLWHILYRMQCSLILLL